MAEIIGPGAEVWVDEGFSNLTPAVVDTVMGDGYLVRDSDGHAWWAAAEHVRLGVADPDC